MGNIYKGHVLRGKKQNRPWDQYKKDHYQVEIVEYKQNGKVIGHSNGDTLEEARIEARKIVDEALSKFQPKKDEN